MLPPTIDFVFRVGRLLGTIRSLCVQTEQIIDLINNYTAVEAILDDGLDI